MDRNSRPLNEVIETGMGFSRLLPSPRATDGTNGGPNQRGSSGDLALPSAVHRLPLFRTPTSQLATNGGSQHPDKRKAGGHGPTLADEVEHLLPLLGTPRVADGLIGGTIEASQGRLAAGKRWRGTLEEGIASLLPTPHGR